MTDLDNSFPASGGGEGPLRPEATAGSSVKVPFFPAPPTTPAPPGPPAPPPMPGQPAQPLVPAQGAGRHSQRSPEMGTLEPERPVAGTTAVVKGRITIEDEVVEKIAALAALEVHGVAALSAHADRPGAPAGGVRVHIHDNEVALDLTVVVEYGSVIMDVAKVVKSNVARVAGLMLGMRVTAVNVVVDDVRMPTDAH